jgi:predicted nuclease of restriction endonuclease-like (RecB) superfamily
MAKTSKGKGKAGTANKRASGTRTKAARPRKELVQSPVGRIESPAPAKRGKPIRPAAPPRRPAAAARGYAQLLDDIKKRVYSARLKAALSVNRELVGLYQEIGKQILKRQSEAGWGKAIVERLSRDLRREFPEHKGFSARNLWDMRRFYEAYRSNPILRQLVAEIPWGHNLVLLNALKTSAEREFYLRQTIAHGWSRNVLVHQIDTGLRQRQGGAVTNFDRTLPPAQSELAMQTIKDPYSFDFLGLGKEAKERDIQDALLGHIRDAILELGQGFAFVGSQYHLEIGNEDFYLDLLFYHIRLRCYVVIELKTGRFMPEHAGKMNFYLSAVDDLLRESKDEPTIGLILCRDKNRIIAEYALRDLKKPLSIASYNLLRKLPRRLQASLPPVAQLEEELGKESWI